MDLIDQVHGKIVMCCERGNEPPVPHHVGNFRAASAECLLASEGVIHAVTETRCT
jgi:hypothetical protein